VQSNQQGMNPYAYVGGNPETDTDPTGTYVATVNHSASAYTNPFNENVTITNMNWSYALFDGGADATGYGETVTTYTHYQLTGYAYTPTYNLQKVENGFGYTPQAKKILKDPHTSIAKKAQVVGGMVIHTAVNLFQACMILCGGDEGVAAEGAVEGAEVGVEAAVDTTENAVEDAEEACTTNCSINPNKFKYLFGEVDSSAHNLARSNQLSLVLKYLGVPFDEEGKALLTENLIGAAQDDSNVVASWDNEYGSFVSKESLFAGPSGKFALFQSTWKVTDEEMQFTTLIPFAARIASIKW
jgi:hypothetical protein